MQWYQQSVEEVFKHLEANGTGLTSTEVSERLVKYGLNELKFKKPSTIARFLRQFNNPLVYVLLLAAAITGTLTILGADMLVDTLVIFGVVIINVILGFIQESKTEGALEALRKMIVSECMVLRDDEEKIVLAREIVPGDVVILNGGDKVPADLRLFLAKDISIDESVLTGESVPVEKNTLSITKPNLSLGDQSCIAFSGTFLIHGYARGVVVTTGINTEFGKITTMVKQIQKVSTPLQRKMTDFTKTLMIGIFILSGINFLLGYLFGFSLSYTFLATIALIVAAIPEMLPMLVTSILALTSSAMAKRNVLIRRLPAAETLGSVTTICSDKTGTLTKNEMTVVEVYTGGKVYQVTGAGYNPSGEFIHEGNKVTLLNNIALTECLRAGLLASNASLIKDNGDYKIAGDPTEGALVVAATKANLKDMHVRIDELPFKSEQMYMATLYKDLENNLLYVKGAPERVIGMCSFQLIDDVIEPLKDREMLIGKSSEMAGDGLRVIGVAYNKVPKTQRTIVGLKMDDLVFLGLYGMLDPPRIEAIEAITKCRKAGIRTIMITGDHIITAKAVAHQLGIFDSSKDNALTGEQLSKMSDDGLYNLVDKTSVYGRVVPEHKLRIARQLQKKGEIVAMTGDGVNDAPALRTADVGISMGISGTDVSKEASAMILTDDNFASIVAGVEEGRHAWNNLEKSILYTLPTNGGQALLIMAAILIAPFVAFFAIRLPLEPIQILWINLFDSVFLTMPLMMEPKEKGLLEVPPRNPKARIANRLFFERVGLVSVAMAATGFLIYWNFGHLALASVNVELVLTQAQTAAFMSVVLFHLGYVMTARSVYKSAFTFSPFSNKWLLGGIILTIVLDLLIVYAPFMNNIFRTMAFPIDWWPYVLLGFLAGFFVLEGEKAARRQFQKRRHKK